MPLAFDSFRVDFSTRFDNFTSTLLETRDKFDALESKQVKQDCINSDLKIKVKALEERVAVMSQPQTKWSQQIFKNKVEIVGVQEIKGEQPVHVDYVLS